MTYELAKNANPEMEVFGGAMTVHPVTEAALMYRLHKRFSRVQLDRTYQEIEELQVDGGGKDPSSSLVGECHLPLVQGRRDLGHPGPVCRAWVGALCPKPDGEDLLAKARA